MSKKSHNEFLKKRAIGEAQKAMNRKGIPKLDSEEFSDLKIQTFEPWKRIFLGILALLFMGAGYVSLSGDTLFLAIIFFLLGSLGLLTSIFGRKKTVRAAVDSIDLITIFEGLF